MWGLSGEKTISFPEITGKRDKELSPKRTEYPRLSQSADRFLIESIVRTEFRDYARIRRTRINVIYLILIFFFSKVLRFACAKQLIRAQYRRGIETSVD